MRLCSVTRASGLPVLGAQGRSQTTGAGFARLSRPEATPQGHRERDYRQSTWQAGSPPYWMGGLMRPSKAGLRPAGVLWCRPPGLQRRAPLAGSLVHGEGLKQSRRNSPLLNFQTSNWRSTKRPNPGGRALLAFVGREGPHHGAAEFRLRCRGDLTRRRAPAWPSRRNPRAPPGALRVPARPR